MPKLNALEVKYWLSEADSCFARQKRELIQRNNYPFLIHYYEGVDRMDVGTNNQGIAQRRLSIINEYFPNVNSLISTIMFRNPDIIAEARKPQAEDGEDIMKSALSYGFDKADALVENRIALFDMIMAGYCAVEVDHLTDTNDRNKKTLLPTDEEVEGRKSFIQKTVEKVKKVMSSKDVEENLAKQAPPEEEAFATNEHTYVRRWNPLDVPLDWRARRLKDRRYNIQRIWLSRAEFNARYPQFENKVFAEDTSFAFSKHDGSEHSSKIKLYQFQIKRKNNRYDSIIISPQISNEEIDMFRRPYTTNGFNMKIGTLHKYGRLYPISYAQVNKRIQDEINNYVRHMMEVSKRNIPKRIADKNKVKGDAITALNSDKVNDLALIDGSPQNALLPSPHTNVSVENKELLGMFSTSKEKLWGVSETSLAGRSPGAQFATEIAIQEAGFQEKQVDIQEGLRFLIREELETFKDIIATFWDGEYFFKVTGGEKPTWYVSVTDPRTGRVLNPLADTLTGDYNIKVDISSSLRPNEARQKAEALAFLKNLVGLMPLLLSQGQTISVKEIARLAKRFGFEPEKLFVPATQTPEGVPLPGAEGAPGAPGVAPAEAGGIGV